MVKEPLKVVLRVRPFTTTEIATGSNISCISVDEGNHIILRNPSTGASKQFQFSSVLSDKVTQKELFDTTISPFMTSFFSGVPSLILAYGVTAAGKTYTINGTNSQPGIIPRITDVILKTLSRHKPEKYRLAKVGLPGANVFQTLTQERIQQARALQQQQQQQLGVKVPPSLLSSGSSTSSSGGLSDLNYSCSDFSVSLASSTASSVFSDAMRSSSTTAGHSGGAADDGADGERIAEYEKLLDKDCDCTLFVSYLEIYNENVYDLLADAQDGFPGSSLSSTVSGAGGSTSAAASAKREGLTIAKDHIKGHTIVRGLRQVPITSYAEAQQAIELGFRNRSCADTGLNRESSRSHAMLTYTLAQYPKGRDLQFLEHEASTLVRYSRISVVDLAGSERLERTNNTGIQVTQASNINNSLLTFRLCVDVLRNNQRNPRAERPVPFRNSKLTRLFQDYFAGSGRAMMIVNVSPKAADYAETSHVIDFGCLAKAVSTTLRTGPPPSSHHLLHPLLSATTTAGAGPAAAGSGVTGARRRGAAIGTATTTAASGNGGGDVWTSEKEEGYNKLLEQVKGLSKKLERIERDHLLAELDLRCEIADEYKELIVARDAVHHKAFGEQLVRVEALCEARLGAMAAACEKAIDAEQARLAAVGAELAKTRKDYEDALNEVSIERAKNTKESADFANSLQKIIAEYKEKNKALIQEIEATKAASQRAAADEKAKILAQCEADVRAVRAEVQAAAAKEVEQLRAEMQREEKEHAEDKQGFLAKIALLQEQLRTIQAKQTAEALTQSGRIIKKVLESSAHMNNSRNDGNGENDGESSSSDDDEEDVDIERNVHGLEEGEEEVQRDEMEEGEEENQRLRNEEDDEEVEEEEEQQQMMMYDAKDDYKKDADYVYNEDYDDDDDDYYYYEGGGGDDNDDDDDDSNSSISSSGRRRRRGKQQHDGLSKSKRRGGINSSGRRKEAAKNNKKMFSKLLDQISPKPKQKSHKRSLGDSQDSDKEIRGLKTPAPLVASPLTPDPPTVSRVVPGGGEGNEAAIGDDDDGIIEELPKKVVNVSRRRKRGRKNEVRELSIKEDVQQTPMKLRSGRRINNN